MTNSPKPMARQCISNLTGYCTARGLSGADRLGGRTQQQSGVAARLGGPYVVSREVTAACHAVSVKAVRYRQLGETTNEVFSIIRIVPLSNSW